MTPLPFNPDYKYYYEEDPYYPILWNVKRNKKMTARMCGKRLAYYTLLNGERKNTYLHQINYWHYFDNTYDGTIKLIDDNPNNLHPDNLQATKHRRSVSNYTKKTNRNVELHPNVIKDNIFHNRVVFNYFGEEYDFGKYNDPHKANEIAEKVEKFIQVIDPGPADLDLYRRMVIFHHLSCL